MKKTMRILFLAAMIVVLVMMTALIASAEGEVPEDDAFFMVTDANGENPLYYDNLEIAVENVPENGTVTFLYDYSAIDDGNYNQWIEDEDEENDSQANVRLKIQHSFTLDGDDYTFETVNGYALQTYNHAPDAVITVKNLIIEGEACYGMDLRGQ